jgi:hypothetical protein
MMVYVRQEVRVDSESYVVRVRKQCNQVEAERDRLRAVVVQARDVAMWYAAYGPYPEAPELRKMLEALAIAAGAALAD